MLISMHVIDMQYVPLTSHHSKSRSRSLTWELLRHIGLDISGRYYTIHKIFMIKYTFYKILSLIIFNIV